MSLWLVDQGNSRLKLASVPWHLVSPAPNAFEAGLRTIALTANVISDTSNHADTAIRVDWQTACARFGVPRAIFAVCVASKNRRTLLIEQWRSSFGDIPVHWLEASCVTADLHSHYTPPASLGADRWAALLAARHFHPEQAMVVASFGTATTVDALTASGHFLGGVIAPGLSLMRASLAQGTAALNVAEGKLAEFPNNTADALHTGCVMALFGLVGQMQQRLVIAGEPLPLVLSTGGAWPAIASMWPIDSTCRAENYETIPHYRAYLVLEGLYRYACGALAP